VSFNFYFIQIPQPTYLPIEKTRNSLTTISPPLPLTTISPLLLVIVTIEDNILGHVSRAPEMHENQTDLIKIKGQSPWITINQD
jgi:hypothetical protein